MIMIFKKKLFSSFIFFISIILLLYTIYKSEFTHSGLFRDYYFPYYIFCILLFITSIFLRYVHQLIYSSAIIFFNTIIISLFSFEIFLQYNPNFYWAPSTKVVEFTSLIQFKKNKIYKEEAKKNYDLRSRNQIYNELRKKNNNISVIVPPASYIGNEFINPLSGISNVETIVCNENGYFSIIDSDRYGFNNPDGEWDKKSNKFLLVGDSFTYGACVNRPSDMGSVLRNYTNKSVLNLGYPGNGPHIQYATLREYLGDNTEHVLFFFFEENDLEDLNQEQSSEILQNYLKDFNFSQNLKDKQKYIDLLNKDKIKKSDTDLNELEKKFNFKNFIKLFETRNLITVFFKPNTGIQFSVDTYLNDYSKILRLTKKLTEEKKAELHLIYLPDYPRYKYDYKKEDLHNKIKNIANELNIHFIDINKEIFDKEKNPLKLFPFEFYGHYNIEGYKKIIIKINNIINNIENKN